MPEKRTLACLIVAEAMWGFYDQDATVFTWYPVKKVKFALMGQARLRRSKAISHKEARYQRSQCECAHVKIAVLCILALFKINSEARSRGIVCEQGLGDHA